VVELFVQRLQRNLFPAASAVARLAALRERAVVRVTMAVGALAVGDAGISRFVVRSGCVALLARDLDMQSGKREASLGVIELLRAYRLPVSRVVALRAVTP